MNKFVFLAVLLLPLAARADVDVATLLAAADRYRTGADALQVETEVTVAGRDGTVEKERRYTVFTQSQRRSLVLMRTPAEAGQKVLMLGDDFWLLMPGSQRPLRITPSQKLLGDASTGDIATLNWADDYSGSLVGDEACPAPDAQRSCHRLVNQISFFGIHVICRIEYGSFFHFCNPRWNTNNHF